MTYAAAMLSTKPVPSIITSNWFSCMLMRIPWRPCSLNYKQAEQDANNERSGHSTRNNLPALNFETLLEKFGTYQIFVPLSKNDIDAMPKADKKDRKSASVPKAREVEKPARHGPKVALAKEILATAETKGDKVRVRCHNFISNGFLKNICFRICRSR